MVDRTSADATGMNWEDVEAFRAVAAQLSFTAAAEALRVGRPAVSRRVQRLERAVGTPLFTRSTRWVRLTVAGARLLRATEEMAAVWREALLDVAANRASTGGQLRIAMHSTDIAQVVHALTEAFPATQWQTQSYGEQASVEALAQGEVDVVVGYATPADGLPAVPGATVELLVDEPTWLAVSASGRWARRRAGVRLAELADEGWIAPPRPGLRRLLDDACRDAGFVPDVRHVTGDATAIRTLVATGQVVSLSSPTVPSGDDVHVVPLIDGPRRLIFLAYRHAALDEVREVQDRAAVLSSTLHEWYAAGARRSPQYWRHIRAELERNEASTAPAPTAPDGPRP